LGKGLLTKLAAQAKIAKMPNKRIDHITKVTFETADGRSFTFWNARVWKLWIPGQSKESMTYQIRGGGIEGEYPDLEEVLPAEPKSEQNKSGG